MAPSDWLALDLGSTIGWATSSGKLVECGEVALKGEIDQRFGEFVQWLRPRLPAVALAIEEPFVGHRKAAASLHGLAGIARGLASAAGLRVVCLSPSTVKLAVTGTGKATKLQVTAAVERLYKIVPPGEHAADALAVLYAARTRERTRERIGG